MALAAWLVGAATGCRSVLGIEDTTLDPAVCALVPQRVFFADKPTSDVTIRLGTITQRRFAELAADVGASLDASSGHGLVEIVDCDGEPTASATATFDPEGAGVTRFVARGDRLAPGTDTGVEGVLGAFDLPAPEEVAVTAFPDEIAVESSQGDLVTRPGELSRIRLHPNSEVMVPPPSADEWSCVGTIPEPVATVERITITVEVEAASTFVGNGIPLEGVQVSICRDEAAACAVDAPVPEGERAVTDAAGRAQLEVAIGGAGFDGQVVVTGALAGCDD